MIGAFLYLQLTTVRNLVWQRLKRLRQPKYLFGALAGAAYFYLVFFRHAFRNPRPRAPGSSDVFTGDILTQLEPFAPPVLFIVVLLAWVLGNSRAALQFSEAETAFLFPAPVSRRTLINFKLLRAQLGILLSAVFMMLVFRRGLPAGHELIHIAGWWVVFSALSLHLLGASFTRQRLLDLGLNPRRQRLLVFGGVLLLLGAGWWMLPAFDSTNIITIFQSARTALMQPPLSWVMAPFGWVTRPFFAADGAAFALAMGPALLVLVAQYVWVLRSDVAFEEASIELAAKRAQLVADLRAGRWNNGHGGPKKPKPEPFRLGVRGAAPIAFLWKNLIALGPLFRLRTWLIACGGLIALVTWLAADRGRSDYLILVMLFSGLTSVALLFGGPMFLAREVQQTLTHLDITKAYPLPGRQIVLGQLLTPMVVMTFGQWFLLLAFVLSVGVAKLKVAALALLGTGGLAGLALVVPPLCGLLLCLPYAGVLYFPAWGLASPQGGGAGGGVEVMGQRLIFFAGYLLVMVVALLPAAAMGGFVFFVANAFIGKITAFVLTTLLVSAVLTAELAGAVWLLGDKLDRFDLSQEMPR